MRSRSAYLKPVVPVGFQHGLPRHVPAAGHAAFGIDDYETALAKLREHDLDVLAFGAQSGQMWVRDPDGNIIELIAVRR